MMAVPKVLAFIDWYKPFYKAGGPVRSMVNLVDHLQDRLDLHIVTGDRDYMAEESELVLPTDRWVAQDKGEQVWYASPGGRSIGRWRELLNDRAWDVVYINGLYSRWSTIVPLWILRGSEQRRIVAVRGMLAQGPMRQGALKKRIYLRVMKALGCFAGVEFQATNADEVEEIKRWMGTEARVHLVPNMGRVLTSEGPIPIDKNPGELRMLSMARIAEEKNTLFAIERLKGLKGAVRYDLYGTIYDAPYWEKCQDAIKALPKNISVEWHGQIDSDSISVLLARSHVLFMPSVGENFGHAMLESLSVGRPLLISDRTPWKRLEAAFAGWDIPLNVPGQFEEVLATLVDMGPEPYRKLSEGAFAMAQRSLSDPTARERTLAMFNA